MAKLEDFSTGRFTTLEEVKPEKVGVSLENTSSVANLSAQAAVLGDAERIEGLYRSISSELSSSANSPSAEAILEKVREKSFHESEKGLIEFLSSSDISFEDKKSLSNAYLDARRANYGTQELISENALMQPSEGETVEAELSRVDVANSLKEINDYKKTVQSIINSEQAKSDGGLVETGIEFLELITPFMESGQAGTILAELRGAETPAEQSKAFLSGLALLGNAKAEIRDTLRRLPPEKRLQVSQSVIDIINNHAGLVITDSNDLARMDYIRAGLEEGYYSNLDKWIDNASSLLDLTLLGGIAGSVIKSGRKVKKLDTVLLDEDATREFNRVMNEGIGLEEVSDPKIRENFRKFFEQEDTVDAEFEDIESATRRRSTRTAVSPTTVSQNYKDTNPSKARIAHEAAAADNTGEASQALYNTNKTEAVANDLLPEVGTNTGSVKNKVSEPDRINNHKITPNQEIMDYVRNDGNIYYFKSEKTKMRAKVVNDFRNAIGMNPRMELSSIKDVDSGVQISMVYGPVEGGWRNVNDAIELTAFSLRDYGVDPSQVKLLRRKGENWVEVDVNEEMRNYAAVQKVMQNPNVTTLLPPDANYLIKVDHNYNFNPADLVEWAEADVKRNVFDWIPPATNGRGGSLNQHIFDAHSSLNPTITKGASVVTDKAVGLEQSLRTFAKGFSQPFSKLPKQRRAMIEKYITEANEQGITFDPIQLKARGFKPNEVQIVKEWRDFWDTHYWLENADLAKSLRANNYKVFWDSGSDTRLFARPVARNQISGSVKYYDQRTGEIKLLKKEEITDLYKSNGSMAQLRQPIKVGDEAVEMVKVDNIAKGSYLRTINDGDEVLNYRQGYYTVYYKDPKFIIKKVVDKKGRVQYEKAVATAGTTKEANLIARRLSSTDGSEYYVRGDVKEENIFQDNNWDVQVSMGRTAQRVRGQRLEDATSHITDLASNNIMDPLESLTRSIRSVARRVSVRDYIEATKQRFLNQYKDVLPNNEWGEPIFPNTVKDIGKPGQKVGKLQADARTTFNYIRYLEEGFVNSIDDSYKATINTIADILGKYEVSLGEKGARSLANMSPTHGLKNTAFQLYLALNPLRQFVVQSHQAILLNSKFPKYTLSGRMVPQMIVLAAGQRGIKPGKALLKAAGMDAKQAQEMIKQFRQSGLYAAVDANNLVRGDLQSLAELTFAVKAVKGAKWPLRFSQRVGFDAGEQINIMSAWLAFRDDALKGGTITPAIADEITANARNFTFNMNAAGDMPYNRNSLNVLFQFLQVPHKVLTLGLTNRILSKPDKAKLIGLNLILFGLPAGVVTDWFLNQLPEDENVRHIVTEGLESFIINKSLSLATGSETRIDFGSLAPADVHGMYDTLASMWTTDIGTIVSNSPSGQLLFGNNPRITNSFRTAMRFFGLVEDNEESPAKFSAVANDFAKLSSGMSNAFKAKYALKYGQKINSAGTRITDSDVNTAEAIAAIFGFETIDEAQSRYVNDQIYTKSKAYKEDVEMWYNNLKRDLASNGHTAEDIRNITRVYSEAHRVWERQPAALEIIDGLIRRDVKEGDDTMFRKALEAMNWMDGNEFKNLVRNLPLPEEKKQELMESLEFIEEYRGE